MCKWFEIKSVFDLIGSVPGNRNPRIFEYHSHNVLYVESILGIRETRINKIKLFITKHGFVQVLRVKYKRVLLNANKIVYRIFTYNSEKF